MVEHGIHTTQADYWVHLFPTENPCRVYWYRVDHMLEHVRLKNPPLKIGKSKDGTATGGGYLIQRGQPFIFDEIVPAWMIEGFAWAGMTDRECGFAGEHIVGILIERRIVTVPVFRVRRTASREEQYASKDFEASYFGKVHFEAKTERVTGSGNLFVQSREGGHRVHLVNTDGNVSERLTDAPDFSDGGRT